MFIIAEIGINHMGSIPLAKHLIRLAHDNGASAVKFQLYDPHKLFSDNKTLLQEALDCQLSREQFERLYVYAANVGIDCFASVFDKERLGWAEDLGVPYHKIATRVALDDPDLCHDIVATGKPVFMSICKEPEIYEDNIEYLVCVPKYPASPGDYAEIRLNVQTAGISDHTIGIHFALFCAKNGAKVIEKHFTIDKELPGSDHVCSMTPDELAELSGRFGG